MEMWRFNHGHVEEDDSLIADGDSPNVPKKECMAS
jgi:hypothetical protein